jgi:FkbM family methyltransferase
MKGIAVHPIIKSKMSEVGMRGLLGYPTDGPADISRIEGLEILLACATGPVRVKLPLSDLIVDFDPRLPAQLLYYITVGDYEQADIDLASEYVVSGDIVMEVGAGIGITGCALAKASQRGVILVEANPHLWEHIEQNFKINGQKLTLIKAAAVSNDFEGSTVPFSVSPNYWWSSLVGMDGGKTFEATAIPLGKLIEEHQPNILVLDIEGAEEFVVPQSLNPCVKKVFVEIHSPALGSKKSAALVRRFEMMGFRMLDIRSYTWVFERI